MGLFSRAKDAAIEQAILKIAQPKFERYGELRQFSLNTEQHSISAEVLLRGESSPITITEGHYRIEEQDGQTYIVLHHIQVSREWAQRILDDHMPEIRLKAPDFVRSLL